jgi:hypothetical protein
LSLCRSLACRCSTVSDIFSHRSLCKSLKVFTASPPAWGEVCIPRPKYSYNSQYSQRQQCSHLYNPVHSHLICPIRPIQFPCRQDLFPLAHSHSRFRTADTYLTPSPLSSNRQTHRVSPPPITSHIPQSLNIIPHLAPQIRLDRHRR